jgi:hypothetical protein
MDRFRRLAHCWYFSQKAHGFNLRAISGFGPAEGKAVVYQPDAKGGFNLVARVLVANWGALAQ